MSFYEISLEFVTFFLRGADQVIIDWFACVFALAMATGIFSLVLYPLLLLIRGVKRK